MCVLGGGALTETEGGPKRPLHLPHPRNLRLDFPGFVRVLAHFRPIDDEDPGIRDPKEPEPLNSRMNKLRCEFVGTHLSPSETLGIPHR